jgi:hypothetical protein
MHVKAGGISFRHFEYSEGFLRNKALRSNSISQ